MTEGEYVRKVFPHLKEEYFTETQDKNFFKIYSRYFSKHNSLPSRQAMLVEIEKLKTSSDTYDSLTELMSKTSEFNESIDYMVQTTETFCKERALYNALRESVLIVDGQTKGKDPGAIPTILQQALSISFDTIIGHDYFEEAAARYEYYHLSEARIPTGTASFDYITRGGFPRKTLNVLLAPPHGGKSLVMSNLGIGAINAGYNVLYITLEMAEFEIGKRFDVNLMGIDFETLESLPKPVFDSKFAKVAEKSRGRFIIQEYPPATAHAGHFRTLLSELKTKKNFVPDMVIVDYMGLCLSERYKASNGTAHHLLIKSVGEELRALAVEHNYACVTAVQTNRSGVGNSDVDMTATSESFGTPAIADWFAAIINTEELQNLKQIMFKQLKNRYRDLNDRNKFMMGVDTSRMKIFDLDDSIPKLNKPNKKATTEQTSVDLLHQIKPASPSFDDFNFDT